MAREEWRKNGYKYVIAFELGMYFMALAVAISEWF